MLVSTMTLEEIRREIEKDFPILRRKIGYVVHDLERETEQRHQKKRILYSSMIIFPSIKTSGFTGWRSLKKNRLVSCMLVYHNGRGHAAIEMTQDEEIIYFTGHFFDVTTNAVNWD